MTLGIEIPRRRYKRKTLKKVQRPTYSVVSETREFVVIKDKNECNRLSVLMEIQDVVDELINALGKRRLEFIDRKGKQWEVKIRAGKVVGLRKVEPHEEKHLHAETYRVIWMERPSDNASRRRIPYRRVGRDIQRPPSALQGISRYRFSSRPMVGKEATSESA